MPTLVIHAPDARAREGKTSFEYILEKGIGDGYAIYEKDYFRLSEGSGVVLLRKDGNKRRAEGRLVRLAETGDKTPQGITRYNVYFRDMREVPYRPERLNRFGVAVIDEP